MNRQNLYLAKIRKKESVCHLLKIYTECYALINCFSFLADDLHEISSLVFLENNNNNNDKKKSKCCPLLL